MDGVPGLSFPGIAPGKTLLYRIPVVQSGPYWYHSQSQFQVQIGLNGALILERREKDSIEFDKQYVVLLSDWTDTNPEIVFSNSKQQSDYYNYQKALSSRASSPSQLGARASKCSPTVKLHCCSFQPAFRYIKSPKKMALE